MERGFFGNIAEKREKDENEQVKKRDMTFKKIEAFLNQGNFTQEMLKQESKKFDKSVLRFGFEVFVWLNLVDKFGEYVANLETSHLTDGEWNQYICSFLENIQKKSENVDYEGVKRDTIEKKQISAQDEQQNKEEEEKAELPRRIYGNNLENETKLEKKNWWEVQRETEIMAVEDLDGWMETFEMHMKRLNVAEKDVDDPNGLFWKWKGKDGKLIFLGDVLGDRDMDGTMLTLIMGDLAYQANQHGGQVDLLCGNHDATFIRFLCGDISEGDVRKKAGILAAQYRGIWELAQYDSDPDSELKNIKNLEKAYGKYGEEELWVKLYERMPFILSNMRRDSVGANILDVICNMKIAVIHDDTLFLHTDPTAEIVMDISKTGDISRRASEINEFFQSGLHDAIHDGKPFGDELKKIIDIYLNTDNRTTFIESDELRKDDNVEKLRKLGINAIIHGHSRSKRTYDDGNFVITTPHDNNEGTAVIRKDGRIDFDKKSFREKNPNLSRTGNLAQPTSDFESSQSPTTPNTPPSPEKLSADQLREAAGQIKTQFNIDVQTDQIAGEDNNWEIMNKFQGALSKIDKEKLSNIKTIGLHQSVSRVLSGEGAVALAYTLSPEEMAVKINELLGEMDRKKAEIFESNQFVKEVRAKSPELLNNLKRQMDEQKVPIKAQLNFLEIVAGAELTSRMVEKLSLIELKFIFIGGANLPREIREIHKVSGILTVGVGSQGGDAQSKEKLAETLNITMLRF